MIETTLYINAIIVLSFLFLTSALIGGTAYYFIKKNGNNKKTTK